MVTLQGTCWEYLLLEDRFDGSIRAEAVALANTMVKELSPNWLGTYTFQIRA